jgi:hypothetical protein
MHEKKYTPFLVEMQALVWALDYFNTYLSGKQFTVFTDHQPLQTQSQQKDKAVNRLTEAFLKYDLVIKYNNKLADFLRRNAIDAVGFFLISGSLNKNKINFAN